MTEPIAQTPPPVSPPSPAPAADLGPFVAAVIHSPDFSNYVAGLEAAAIQHATEHLGAAQPLAELLGKMFLGYLTDRLFRA